MENNGLPLWDDCSAPDPDMDYALNGPQNDTTQPDTNGEQHGNA